MQAGKNRFFVFECYVDDNSIVTTAAFSNTVLNADSLLPGHRKKIAVVSPILKHKIFITNTINNKPTLLLFVSLHFFTGVVNSCLFLFAYASFSAIAF